MESSTGKRYSGRVFTGREIEQVRELIDFYLANARLLREGLEAVEAGLPGPELVPPRGFEPLSRG